MDYRTQIQGAAVTLAKVIGALESSGISPLGLAL